MNKTYKIVFNTARGIRMVVNEATSSINRGTKVATIVAVAGLCLSSVASAVTFDAPVKLDGTYDLSTLGSEYIVSTTTDTALKTDKGFELGNDRNTGKISFSGPSAVFLTGGTQSAGSMTANEITIKSTSSNGMTLYAPLTLTGNTITLNSKYNTVQLGENIQGALTINGGSVNVTSDQHIAFHACWGGNINVTADSLTITAPKAIQTMTNTDKSGSYSGSIVINTKHAEINGDIVSRGTDTSIYLKMDEGEFKGRVSEQSTGSKGTTLVLGEKATWTVTNGEPNNYDPENPPKDPYYGAGDGDSSVNSLTVHGKIDMSQVDKNVTVNTKLEGTGDIVLDPTRTNSLIAQNADASQATLTAVSSKNADEVTTEQAKAMVDRLVGVKEKMGFVEEGKYHGEITVDNAGNATQQTNSVMSGVLDLSSGTNLFLNRILMNDVRKRLGDIRSVQSTHGVWARYDGGKVSGGQQFKTDFSTIQVGIDTVPTVDAPRFGIAFSYTKADADLKRGGADMDAYSLTAYATKFYDNGVFVDVIGRMGTAKSDVTIDGNLTGSMDSMVLSLSGEVGQRFNLTPSVYLEPQAELTYTYIDADKLTLSDNTTYEFDATKSLIGRLGVATGLICPNERGDVYLRASVVNEFLGDQTVHGGTAVHKIEGDDTWFEYGIGANLNLNTNTYLYLDLERTAGASLDEDWRANLGVRLSF